MAKYRATLGSTTVEFDHEPTQQDLAEVEKSLNLQGNGSTPPAPQAPQTAGPFKDAAPYDESSHLDLLAHSIDATKSLVNYAADNFSKTPQNLNIPARIEANAAQSVDEFANQKAERNVFGVGLPMPVSAKDVATPANLPGLVGKGLVNAVPALAYSAVDVGTFLWNVNNHPVNSAIKILSDPVSFAEGLLGDAIKQPLYGLAQGANDLATGKGWKQALQDAGAGIEKGAIAFFNDPITSILQAKFAKDFIQEPIKTTKSISDSATKPLQDIGRNIAETADKSIRGVADTGSLREGVKQGVMQQVQQMSSQFASKLNGLKTGLTMFTKDGAAKMRGAATQESFNYAESFFNVENYKEQLKNADLNTAARANLEAQLSEAQSNLETSQRNLDAMGKTSAVQQRDAFQQNAYENPQAAADSLSQKVSSEKEAATNEYKQAFNKPDGSPIQIGDVKPVVDALRAKADKMGEAGVGSPVTKVVRNFADALDLRQKITAAGGVEAYVEQLANEHVKQNTTGGKYTSSDGYPLDPNNQQHMGGEMGALREKFAADVHKQMQGTGQDSAFFNKPMNAQEFNTAWSQFYNQRLPNSNDTIDYHLANDTGGSSAVGAKEQVLKDSIQPENPAGYQYKQQADAAWKKNNEAAKLFEGKKFSTFDKMGSFVVENWAAIKQHAPEMVQKLQNTLVTNILHENIDSATGDVNYNGIAKGLEKYSSVLNSFQQQVLKTASLYSNLGEVTISDPVIAENLKGAMAAKEGVTAQEQGVQTLEQQTKDVAAQQKIFGTNPEEIVTNMKKLKSEEEVQSFMKASNGQDPLTLGKSYIQSTFENNYVDGKPTLEGMIKSVKEAKQLGDQSNTASGSIKDTFYGKPGGGVRMGLDHLEILLERAKAFQDVEGMPAVKRVLSVGLATGMSMLGWHKSAIATALSAISPASVAETGKAQVTREMVDKAMAELAAKKEYKSERNKALFAALLKMIPAGQGEKKIEGGN